MEQPCWPSDTTFYLEWTREIEIHFLSGYLTLNPLSGEHAKTALTMSSYIKSTDGGDYCLLDSIADLWHKCQYECE